MRLPAVPDVFYFGNAVGESGNVTGDYSVSITDELIARNNPVSINPGTTVINRFDYNRDGTVSVVDRLLARNNINTAATRLRQITVPSGLRDQAFVALEHPAPSTTRDQSSERATAAAWTSVRQSATGLSSVAVDYVFEADVSNVQASERPLRRPARPTSSAALDTIWLESIRDF